MQIVIIIVIWQKIQKETQSWQPSRIHKNLWELEVSEQHKR